MTRLFAFEYVLRIFVLSIWSHRVDRQFVSCFSAVLHRAMNRWVGIGILFIIGEADILFVVFYFFHDYPARLNSKRLHMFTR